MKKIIIKGFLIGLILLVIGMIMGPLTHALFPGLKTEYQNPALFRPWSDPLMSLFFLVPFINGFLLVWVWEKTKKLFKESVWWNKGFLFGLIYWLTSFPGMLMSYSSFPISLAMTLSWSLSIFVQGIATGILLSKFDPQ